ncbi:uncharacterized protein LOC141631336 [Silene latifolia]|uniref:uncharacterized protein LOC141631336 n=1 Tax=Silene latifolia TaxID=37657 RepID=UPI003D779BC4
MAVMTFSENTFSSLASSSKSPKKSQNSSKKSQNKQNVTADQVDTRNVPLNSSPKVPQTTDTGMTKLMNEVQGIPVLNLDEGRSEQPGTGWVLRRGGRDVPIMSTINEEEEFEDILQFTSDDVKKEVAFWNHSVVCYILGANPSWDVIEDYVFNVWDQFGVDRVSFMDNVVYFLDEFGNKVEVKVEYEWRPVACVVCKGYGHDGHQCRKKAAERKPKAVTPLFTPEVFPPLAKGISSTPARQLMRMNRQDGVFGQKVVGKSGAYTFMDALNGMTTPGARKVVKWFMHNNGVGLFGLLETKLKPSGLLNKNSSLCDGWSVSTNCSWHKGGRIWVLWNPLCFEVTFLAYGAQFIHMMESGVALYLGCGGTLIFVLFSVERPGGNTTEAEMQQFQDCVSICGMEDLSATGALFTWSNKQDAGSRVYSRLDRIMGNQDWMDNFGEYLAHFHPEGLFDHCPCTLVDRQTDFGGKKSFKYFNMWGSAEEFKECVSGVWKNTYGGTKMFKVIKKLKALKPALKLLNKTCFSDVENSTVIASALLEEVQKKIMEQPGDMELIQNEYNLSQEVRALIEARDSFLAQKAKIQCSIAGDINNAYFHHAIKKRTMLNKVMQIETKDGVLCTEGSKIQQAFLDYYEELLGKSNQTNDVNVNVVRRGSCCTDDHWALLAKPVTFEEIGESVSLVFLRTNLLINSTVITLIPKVDRPTNVTHFRPISCCNVIYKTISKLLCNRLALVLPDIISRNQGAFVKGRSILENILICQDLVRYYSRKTVSSRSMFKLDLQKAYDTIEWGFVEQMLGALHFPEKFKGLIMSCITSTSFTLNLNDDLMLFCKGDVRSMMLLLRAISTFSASSGLRVNASKSEVIFNGVSDAVRADIVQISGFKEGQLPLRYLGIPIQPGRNYLWDGGAEYQRAPLVAWHTVCCTKKEGGLGIKEARVWNIATVGKLVNWIYTKADRLWVLWIDHVYMKGGDWNSYTPPTDVNWNWRNICKVKSRMATGFQNGVWVHDPKGYSVSSRYCWLQGTHPPMQWYEDVWDSWCVPKHAFIGWLIKREALNTRLKLKHMGVCTTDSCVLCEGGPESHDHLFQDCPYSVRVIGFIEDWLQLKLLSPGLHYTMQQRRIGRVALLACWYHLWQEKNRCRLELNLHTPGCVGEAIKKLVTVRLRGCNIIPARRSEKEWLQRIGVIIS